MNNYFIFITLVMMLLSACDKPESQLEHYIKSLRSRPIDKIDPLPEIKPINLFVDHIYQSTSNPFEPMHQSSDPKHSLENIALSTLKFIGVIKDGKHIWALIKQSNDLIYRAQIGDPVGENHGRLLAIDDTELTIEQTLKDHKRRVLISVG